MKNLLLIFLAVGTMTTLKECQCGHAGQLSVISKEKRFKAQTPQGKTRDYYQPKFGH